MKTWLITGCSSGLGRAIAEAVLLAGDNVIVTARNVTTLSSLANRYPQQAHAQVLDVTDPSQVEAVVQNALARFGSIDVLVNNAGYGYRAAIEEAPVHDIRELFETHVFGSICTIKAVLPSMRTNGFGRIVNISSIGVHMAPPGSGYYTAAKSAVEGLTRSLDKEVRTFGIAAMIVEPGAFRTDFAGRSLKGTASTLEDYEPIIGDRRPEADASNGTQPGDPTRAALAIIEAVNSQNPPGMLVLGVDAFAVYRESMERNLEELSTWAELSLSTNFDLDSEAR